MGLQDFLKSRTCVVIISIIWGLGLATLFKKSCEGKKCNIIQYKGPDLNWINNSIFNYGTPNCYKYKPILNSC